MASAGRTSSTRAPVVSIDLVASVTIIASGGSAPGLRSDGNSKPLFITGAAGWQAMADRLGP
jgi:thiamine biosynthesis lipoprotein